jgi:transcriptional regulator with XRE-family HTH domain
VDFERLDASTDADISPSTIRRWRRGAVSPTAANLQRLQERVSTSF